MFQAYNLLPVLTAQENVEFILQLQGVDKQQRRERAAQALDNLGLVSWVSAGRVNCRVGNNSVSPLRGQL